MMPTCDRCGVSLYYPNNVIGKESVCTNCFQKEKEKMFEDTEQVKETVNQDIKRDLKADLALCNKIKELDGFQTNNFEKFAEVERVVAKYAENVKEGWPYAIQRAIEAEELSGEFVEVINDLLCEYEDLILRLPCSTPGGQPIHYDSQSAKRAEDMVTKAKEVLKND